MTGATDPALLDELLGFRAQFSDSECDGSPLRIRTENGENEQTEANLRAVLWDAAQRLKDQDAALAAVTADRDAQRDRAARAERERDEAVAVARRDALEEAARIADEWAAELDRHVTRYGNAAAIDIARDIRAAALAARTGGRADG